jgi:hypothetical protein
MNVGKLSPTPTRAGEGRADDWALVAAKFKSLSLSAEVQKALLDMTMMTASSINALGPAMAAFKGVTSPQLARAIQATENIWKDIDAEFGMLTSMEVAQLIGSKRSGRSFASDQRAAGKLLGIKRGNRVLYPGFQFERATGTVHAAIPELLHMAKDVSWDEEDLTLWLIAPSGYFHGDRPVDHLADADVVPKARQEATIEW